MPDLINFGTRLRALRGDMSLRRLAMLSHVGRSYISELERGLKQPSFETARALDKVLGAGGELVVLATAAGPRRYLWQWGRDNAGDMINLLNDGDPVADEVEAMDRRAVLAASLAAPFVATFSGVGPRVNPDEAEQIRQMVPELYRLDDQAGGDTVARAAAWCLGRVDQLIQAADYTDSTGRVLQVAFGELAEMVGWLAFDAGQIRRSAYYFGEALRAAQLADDLDLEVLVLASMNTLARYRRRPREAVSLIQLAQRRSAGWAPPRLAALLKAREAVSWAMLSDAAESRRIMHQAENVYRPEIGSDDPAWIGFVGRAELDALHAIAAEHLGHSATAVESMRAAVDGLDARYQRNRASYGVKLGLLLAGRGDVDQACTVVGPLLPLFREVRSGRALDRLDRFLAAAGDSRRPAALELTECAHELGLR